MTQRSKLFKFILFTIIVIGIGACEKDKIDVQEFGAVTGIVLDATTNLPIVAANISTNPASASILSDADGKFTITQVPIGSVVVTAQKDQYATGTSKVSVMANQTTDVVILQAPLDPSQHVVKFSNPKPANESVDQPRLDLTLAWQVADNAGFDSLRFDVIIFESQGLEQYTVASGIADTFTVVEVLDFAKTYYWQVVAKENDLELSRSTIWTFGTLPFPDVPFYYAQKVNGAYEIFNSDSTFTDTTAPIIQLTNFTGARTWNPQLNPDRDLIAFTSDHEGPMHIYHMKRDGSDLKKVTTLPNVSYNNKGLGYCWAPDGESILYCYYDKLYKITKNGSWTTEVSVAPAGMNYRNCNWNGHTNKIIVQATKQMVYESEFYVMSADGSNFQLFLEDWPGRMDDPSFSIDGSSVLFSWDADGYNSADGRMLNSRIYTISTDTIHADTLDMSEGKADGTNDMNPRFSPDGAWVVFVNQSNTGLGPTVAWVMDFEGGSRQPIIDNAETPFWGATDNK